MRQRVDEVVDAQPIGIVGGIGIVEPFRGPLPVLGDVAVVIREREHPIVRIVVDEQRPVIGLHVDGGMRRKRVGCFTFVPEQAPL